jgi:hypothetical protein
MKVEDWIKVEDRLPEEWELVLIYYEAGIIGLAYWCGMERGWLSDDDQEMATPDYWLLIVEPKKE